MSSALNSNFNLEQVSSSSFKFTCKEKVPSFSALPAASQAELVEKFLEVCRKTNAAGMTIFARCGNGGKPLEWTVIAMGELSEDEGVRMPIFGKRECPFHQSQEIVEGFNLVATLTSKSGNQLVVTKECRPHLFACTPDEITELFKLAETLIAGSREKWSGNIYSQVGVVGGQKVPHAHLHIARGVQEENIDSL